MLTLLINLALGGIVAITLASLIASMRAFLPAWRRLSADLASYDNKPAVQVTMRDARYGMEPLPELAAIYRPAFAKQAIKPQAMALHSCLPAAA